MARIRTVKPEFWKHPVMGRLDDPAKCLALALLNVADDEGFFLADRTLVRNDCRPFDEDSTITRVCIDTLVEVEWIEVREHRTHGPIGRIVNFANHQRIDRPSPSKIKDYFFAEDSSSYTRTLVGGKEGKGKDQGREIENADAAAQVKPLKRVPPLTPLRNQEAQEAFSRVWDLWPSKRPDGHHAKGDKVPAERAFQKILDTQAATAAELEGAAAAYLANHPRVKEGFIVYVSTFYGPEKAMWMEAVRVLRDRAARAEVEAGRRL